MALSCYVIFAVLFYYIDCYSYLIFLGFNTIFLRDASCQLTSPSLLYVLIFSYCYSDLIGVIKVDLRSSLSIDLVNTFRRLLEGCLAPMFGIPTKSEAFLALGDAY